jgi:3',5'-nucleoside bisphosphate phosphatase
MTYDLHTHTYYSDGQCSPQELIEEAARRGLKGLAITDHDNARGAREARPLAAAAGIELIPAMEMTTSWPGAKLPPRQRDVDILGYFIDIDSPVLQAFERAMLNDLHERIGSSCRTLTEQGWPVSMEDVFAENPRYGGAVQAIFALIHLGHAPDWSAASKMFDPAWFSERETPFTVRTAIEQIHWAGGKAVLAHPAIVMPEGQLMTARWLAQLVDWGLDGVEIYHRHLDEPTQAHFLALAKQFNLLITGGSDTHGWWGGFDRLGEQPITAEMVEALRT